MYYKTCSHCGAHLDPGERCDCRTYTTITFKAGADAGRTERRNPYERSTDRCRSGTRDRSA